MARELVEAVANMKEKGAFRSSTTSSPKAKTRRSRDIVGFMLEVNGFKVHDLGIDQPEANFPSTVREHHPHVPAFSGFLLRGLRQRDGRGGLR
jgi:hypothetical protein